MADKKPSKKPTPATNNESADLTVKKPAAKKAVVAEETKAAKAPVKAKKAAAVAVEEAVATPVGTPAFAGPRQGGSMPAEVVAAAPAKDLGQLEVRGSRYFFSRDSQFVPLPNLIDTQIASFRDFLEQGIAEVLAEFSPIGDYSGKKIDINFLSHSLEAPKYTPYECHLKNLSYEANLKVRVQIVNKETGEVKESDVYLGAVPMMTEQGSFIISGIERVVISQVVRSDGATIVRDASEGPGAIVAKMIPKRGAWLEVDYDSKGTLGVKIDRRRRLPITTFLRALGYDNEKAITSLFADITKGMDRDPIAITLEKDSVKSADEAFLAIYKRIRPGDLVTAKAAATTFANMFYDIRAYDIGRIARYKMNEKFGMTHDENDHATRIFMKEDFVALVRQMLQVIKGELQADDIDFLGNRRIRGVGELVEQKFRVGLSRVERIAKDRLSVVELESITANQIINSRPITAAMHEFFASSQLSQFMDQTNALSEVEAKRRLSALGPGGLSRERAGFEVRDVHTSHYGRICPIATPEGPNIGLVTHLASYAKINRYGFIETPYRVLSRTAANDGAAAVNRIARKDLMIGDKLIVAEDDIITAAAAKELAKDKAQAELPVRAYVTDRYEYFSAQAEMGRVIAQASVRLDEYGNIADKRIPGRKDGEPGTLHVDDMELIDINPKQIFSISTALIPFVEHDDANRALMGTNMMRQAVPVVHAEAPVVGTGMESAVAYGSGYCLYAEDDGEVTNVSGNSVTVAYRSGQKTTYKLRSFEASNQSTVVHQKPVVHPGQAVKRGQVLVDAQGIDHGELAVGKNLLAAYMCWDGYNYEDAIIISDRVFRDDLYSSIHIEEYVCDIRETKLGDEQVTRDIPNVAMSRLADLDENGIVRIGASVKEGDILVGKITPKGESDLTPEERLLQAIFGEKAKDIKDTSLKLPASKWGKVIDVHILTRGNGDELPSGVKQQIKVYVAQLRKVSVGDKMAGRHGNKGVISRIVPVEDMPHLADGTPIDIMLNPLGVSARMNIGQIMEVTLGWAARQLGIRIATPALSGIKEPVMNSLLEQAGLPIDGKVQLFDGRTGEPFDHKTTVGVAYMLKLHHLVEDKIHARSVGPYSLVTQQPLGGKAQHGGQRFGEMEVWALEAYAAAHTLQEMLTIKSDDTRGRAKSYERIIKNEQIDKPSLPESFNVLVRELQSLGLKVELQDAEGRGHLLTEFFTEEEGGPQLRIEDPAAPNDQSKYVLPPEDDLMIEEGKDVPEAIAMTEEFMPEESLTEIDVESGDITPEGMTDDMKDMDESK